MSKEKILVRDETNLGHSYYIDDDVTYGDGYYYDSSTGKIVDDDNDDDVTYGDGYYYDSSTGKIVDSRNDGNSSTTSYYPSTYDNGYYPSTYDYDRRYSRYGLTLDGDTLKVGSNYNEDIWLDDYSRYDDVKVLDAEDNSHDLYLAGNDRNNSIISGEGRTTLFGNGGDRNTLLGGDGRNYFVFNGKTDDVASVFGTGALSNSDVLVLSNVNYKSINRDSGTVAFNAPNGNRMQLRTRNASEEDPIQVLWGGSNILKFQVAYDSSTQMNYHSDIHTFYFAKPAQINVSGDNHNIRLDGFGGQVFKNVNTINAASSYGYNTLIGNAGANVIIGGSGVSTLWGGEDTAADTLIGGSGAEIFWVGKNEGSDVVVTNEMQDLICLRSTYLGDITYVNMDANQLVAGFNTGAQLTVRNSANVTSTFQLADGSKFNYHRDSGQWTTP